MTIVSSHLHFGKNKNNKSISNKRKEAWAAYQRKRQRERDILAGRFDRRNITQPQLATQQSSQHIGDTVTLAGAQSNTHKVAATGVPMISPDAATPLITMDKDQQRVYQEAIKSANKSVPPQPHPPIGLSYHQYRAIDMLHDTNRRLNLLGIPLPAGEDVNKFVIEHGEQALPLAYAREIYTMRAEAGQQPLPPWPSVENTVMDTDVHKGHIWAIESAVESKAPLPPETGLTYDQYMIINKTHEINRVLAQASVAVPAQDVNQFAIQVGGGPNAFRVHFTLPEKRT